jgi:hypothetical protein
VKARAVNKWLYAICLRDYGRDLSKAEKLFLWAIYSHCGKSAQCHPGQDRIAECAPLGVSTVRRCTASASKKGWVAVYDRGCAGKKNRPYLYRLAVPNTINLAAIPVTENKNGAQLSDEFEAAYGRIDDANVSGRLRQQKGKKRAPPRAGGIRRMEAPPAAVTNDRPQTPTLPAGTVTNDRPQRGGKSPFLSLNQKVTKEEGDASATHHLNNSFLVEAKNGEDQRMFSGRLFASDGPQKRPIDDKTLLDVVRSYQGAGMSIGEIVRQLENNYSGIIFERVSALAERLASIGKPVVVNALFAEESSTVGNLMDSTQAGGVA